MSWNERTLAPAGEVNLDLVGQELKRFFLINYEKTYFYILSYVCGNFFLLIIL